MRRLLAVALVAALLVPTAVAVGTTPPPKPSIASVEVTPEPAVVGESITVAPTIRNDPTATGDFRINAVALRTAGGEQLREYTRVEDVGIITPGGSVRIPFEVSFGDAGTKRFRVVVFGENDAGNTTRLEYPVAVQVRDDHPDIRVTSDRTLTAGVRESLNVTVTNGFDREIRSVSVEFDSEGLATSPAEAGTPRIAAGEAATFGFTMQANTPRDDVVEVTVRYRTTTGLERETRAVRTLSFGPLREDVSIDAGVPPEGNTTVPVTVGNFGNAPLENVVVRASATNGTVPPVPVGTLDPGTTRQVLLRVNDVGTRADLDITATYDLAGETRTVSTTSRVRAAADVPGEVELTGLDTELEDGRVHVLGSAANVGLRQVNSVTVRVLPAEGVEPAAPNREYFVGTVPASDFTSFDVYASVEGNVTEIPLEVSYLTDGERRTFTTSVPYDAPAEPSGNTNDGGGGGLLVLGAGVVIALLVVVLVVVGWRSRGE